MTPDMTGTDTGVDPEGAAFGLAQRRSWVFAAWWYPGVLSVSGAVQAGLALAVGQSAEAGIVLASLGAVSAALGWAFTAGQRFTRRPPKPASDIPRVEQGIRTTPIMVLTILIASGLGVGALVLFTPRGGSPESLPLLGMLVIWPLGLAAGLAYTRRLMIESPTLYAQWIERR